MSELVLDDQVVKHTPPRKRSRAMTTGVRSGAISSSQSAKPALPAAVIPMVARARCAETSAPISAPTPKTAERRPKSWGPEFRVCLASTGSKTLKLRQKVLTTNVRTSISRICSWFRANESPSLRLMKRVRDRARRSTEWNSCGRIIRRPASTAM